MSGLMKAAAAATASRPPLSSSVSNSIPHMSKGPSSAPVSMVTDTKGNKGKAKLQDSNVDRKVKSILGGLRSRFFSASNKMRDMFIEWDADGSGTIDPNELGNALGALGYQVTHDEAEAVVSAFDDNGDGVIQYEDFVSLLCGNEGEGHSVTAVGHDLSFTAPNAQDKVDPNLGGKILTWCGVTARNPQGINDILNQRRAGVIDIADGRGGDPLKESAYLSRQRAIEERRRDFMKNVTGKHISHYVAGLAGDATIIDRSGENSGAELLGRDTTSGSMSSDAEGGGHREQIIEDGGALMSTQHSHLSLSATAAHQPDAMTSVFLGPASDAASTRPLPPLNTLREKPAILDGASNQNDRNKNAWRPLQLPITTGVDLSLTARAKVPKQTWARDTGPMVIIDAEADPTVAAPDTGKGTVVTGPIGGVYRTQDAFKLRVIKEVDKLRRTGKGVLEHVLGPSMGARARNDSPQPTIDRNAFTTRAVDLSEKTLSNLYTPMRSAKREELHSKRMEEYLQRTGRSQLTSNFSDAASTVSSRDERRQEISSRGSGGGGGGSDSGDASGVTTADAMRAARLAKLERLGLSKNNVAGGDSSAAATSGHSHVMERLVNVNDLSVKLQRFEGERTTFLIAPPPNVLTSHSSEDKGWHYASSARIAQTGRRVPEQYFASLSLADKMSNIREQTMDYTARVENNQQLERIARASRDAARIESKQRQYAQYVASIKLQTDKNEAMHALAEGGNNDDIHRRGHLDHSERHARGLGRSGGDSFESLANSSAR